MIINIKIPLILISAIGILATHAQDIKISQHYGPAINEYLSLDSIVYSLDNLPLFSFRRQDSLIFSGGNKEIHSSDSVYFYIDTLIYGTIHRDSTFLNGIKLHVTITNNTHDTVNLENVVPFGQTENNIFITSDGSWSLTRAKLFLPHKEPLGVILPDNAWEMGYGTYQLDNNLSIFPYHLLVVFLI